MCQSLRMTPKYVTEILMKFLEASSTVVMKRFMISSKENSIEQLRISN